MMKSEETANPNSCWSKAAPETRMFIVLDWDEAAPSTIRGWCLDRVRLGLNKQNDPQIVEAYAIADEIERNLPTIRKARAARAGLNPAAAWPFPPERVGTGG